MDKTTRPMPFTPTPQESAKWRSIWLAGMVALIALMLTTLLIFGDRL